MATRREQKVRGVYERDPGSGVWWIRYSVSGRIRRECVGGRAAAKALIEKRRTAVREGEKLPPSKSRQVRVRDLCDVAIRHYRGSKSFRSLEQRIDVIRSELGNEIAKDLSPREIRDWLLRMEEIRNWSPATTNRYKSVLSAVYQLAVDDETLDDNPARRVRKREEQQHEIRPLTIEEEEMLIEAIRKVAPQQLPAFLVALHTGMRLSEQFGLTWDRVQLAERYLLLIRTKTDKPRKVYLNRTAHAALSELAKHKPEDGSVFPSSRYKGRSIRDPKRWWKAALKEAGIRHIRWHDLRHTTISRLVMAGVDLRTVQELVGHSDIKMLARYAHLAPAHNLQAIERLDRPTA